MSRDQLDNSTNSDEHKTAAAATQEHCRDLNGKQHGTEQPIGLSPRVQWPGAGAPEKQIVEIQVES